ncbi:hypothetical protein HMJ29_13705 [Hymenobacter taeanensis]|uniref:Uncharacterized protein n=1 Tax=Hymenobacter taeanensis TaxID=2735321 RepID=A0A6M6BJ70_9BACT|nr:MULTISPECIES: hypothetical protein [Hymenobacter]QJX47938.1 hypothetical protein HMJ29_13705 [Hymenobacter taeanensis]UOQ82612.1 hypothetical protein MUN83_07595 [Hymenobacter sp. 5414T-23]
MEPTPEHIQPTPEHTPATDPRNASDDQQQNNRYNTGEAPEPTVGHGHKSPDYGDFGKAPSTENAAHSEHSQTQGGKVAPSVAYTEQRGSTPQNLDPALAHEVADLEYQEQREGWAADDPRYGGGTRNWATAEPANHSTGPAVDDEDKPLNPNVGKNDNPDEFSSLRPDGGAGIPGK